MNMEVALDDFILHNHHDKAFFVLLGLEEMQ